MSTSVESTSLSPPRSLSPCLIAVYLKVCLGIHTYIRNTNYHVLLLLLLIQQSGVATLSYSSKEAVHMFVLSAKLPLNATNLDDDDDDGDSNNHFVTPFYR